MTESTVTLRLLTIAETAHYLKVSVRSVQRMLNDGELTRVWPRGSCRIDLQEIDRYIERRKETTLRG